MGHLLRLQYWTAKSRSLEARPCDRYSGAVETSPMPPRGNTTPCMIIRFRIEFLSARKEQKAAHIEENLSHENANSAHDFAVDASDKDGIHIRVRIFVKVSFKICSTCLWKDRGNVVKPTFQFLRRQCSKRHSMRFRLHKIHEFCRVKCENDLSTQTPVTQRRLPHYEVLRRQHCQRLQHCKRLGLKNQERKKPHNNHTSTCVEMEWDRIDTADLTAGNIIRIFELRAAIR